MNSENTKAEEKFKINKYKQRLNVNNNINNKQSNLINKQIGGGTEQISHRLLSPSHRLKTRVIREGLENNSQLLSNNSNINNGIHLKTEETCFNRNQLKCGMLEGNQQEKIPQFNCKQTKKVDFELNNKGEKGNLHYGVQDRSTSLSTENSVEEKTIPRQQKTSELCVGGLHLDLSVRKR